MQNRPWRADPPATRWAQKNLPPAFSASVPGTSSSSGTPRPRAAAGVPAPGPSGRRERMASIRSRRARISSARDPRLAVRAGFLVASPIVFAGQAL